VLPHRNPVVTAKMFSTLDVLSKGRMILGAGIGWMEEEITLLGAPFNKRGALSGLSHKFLYKTVLIPCEPEN
jgi:alkanesulfonate monooxygenase SsuD/methylene tetrahydromethanopterin reductase-like flavin-dependent oxidoreductase (luciferase family)